MVYFKGVILCLAMPVRFAECMVATGNHGSTYSCSVFSVRACVALPACGGGVTLLFLALLCCQVVVLLLVTAAAEEAAC
jgi:hypothetical protein